jgi:PEP-CTERM motif
MHSGCLGFSYFIQGRNLNRGILVTLRKQTMNYKKAFKLAPIAAALGLSAGIASNAQADVYAYSFLEISELNTVFTCSVSGVGCGYVPYAGEEGPVNTGAFSFENYVAKSTASAGIDGVGGSASQESVATVNASGQITDFTVNNPGSVSTAANDATPDAPYQFVGSAIGNTQPDPGENFYSGTSFVAGENFARGDSQQVSAAVGILVGQGTGTTDVRTVGESGLTGTTNGEGGGSNTSQTGLELSFAISETFTLGFDFTADAAMVSARDENGLKAFGEIVVSFRLLQGNTLVFEWQPDGTGNNPLGDNFLVGADPFTLNTDVTAPANDSETYFGSGGSFGGVSVDLDAGAYTLFLTMSSRVETTNQAAVPLPGTLALFGLGLLGLGGLRQRGSRKV